MRDVKISFRVSDPEVAEMLERKKQNGEMSAFINEALRFYKDNHLEILEIKRELKAIKEILESGGVTYVGGDKTETKQKIISPAEEVLLNGLDVFL
jgi:hypothetical protein